MKKHSWANSWNNYWVLVKKKKIHPIMKKKTNLYLNLNLNLGLNLNLNLNLSLNLRTIVLQMKSCNLIHPLLTYQKDSQKQITKGLLKQPAQCTSFSNIMNYMKTITIGRPLTNCYIKNNCIMERLQKAQ